MLKLIRKISLVVVGCSVPLSVIRYLSSVLIDDSLVVVYCYGHEIIGWGDKKCNSSNNANSVSVLLCISLVSC